MKPRPDPDLLEQWVVRDGVPPSQVGTRLGLSRATGYEWLRRYAIRSGGPTASQAELRAAWQVTRSAERIAAETGLPADAVAERLITAGDMTSARPYVMVGASEDPLPEEQLRRWHVEEGRTAGQIAAMTGTTVRQVRYRLSQHGLTRRRAEPTSQPVPQPAPPPAPALTPQPEPPAAARRASRTDPALLGRLRSTRQRTRAATTTASNNLVVLTETIERLRATTLEARGAVQRSRRLAAGADRRPHG